MEVESHDYGGNLVLPWFGLNRPGLDYYLSNLNIYMFVMSKVTRYGTLHNLYIYDERAAGKDGDALCSLRFNNYMMEYISQRNNNELKKDHAFCSLFSIIVSDKTNPIAC